MAAYALARFRFIGHRPVMMFLITTQMFPLVLLCIPYFRIFITLGLYDTLLSLIIVYLTFTLPFCILMLRSYFLNIPKDIEEAAMVDGCSRLGAILRTLVPISCLRRRRPLLLPPRLERVPVRRRAHRVLGQPGPYDGNLQPDG
jgi:multiple sugar transport system permease protein